MSSVSPLGNNIFATALEEINSTLEDFKVLGQIQYGYKIGVKSDKHFYISSGDATTFFGDLVQRASRGIWGEILNPSMEELEKKIGQLNLRIKFFDIESKDLLRSLEPSQIHAFKKQLELDIAILDAASVGLKNLAETYRDFEPENEEPKNDEKETPFLINRDMTFKKIDDNESSVSNISQKLKSILKKLEDEVIYIPEAEEILEVLKRRIETNPQDNEGIFRIGGSDSTIKELLQKIEDKKEAKRLNLHQFDTPVLTTLLKRILKNKILIIKDEYKYGYLMLSSISSDQEKITILKDIFSNVAPEKKVFLRKLFKLCEDISSKAETKMTMDTLATSLAMNFIQESTEQKKIFEESVRATPVFRFIMTHYDEILE